MLTRRVTNRASMPASGNSARSRSMRPATSRAGSSAVVMMQRSWCSVLQDGQGGFDGEAVAGAAEPGDGAGGDGGDHRGAAPRLAGGGVGQVDLDDDSIVGGQGVGQGVGVVGESARIEDDGRRPAPGAVDGVDQGALVVRLEVFDLVAGGGGRLPGGGHVVVERGLPVDPGLPLPEEVEVGARQHEDQLGRHHPRSSRSAAATPKPTMMAGSSRADPRARLPTTTATTTPVRPTASPKTKATTARPNSDQPAR